MHNHMVRAYLDREEAGGWLASIIRVFKVYAIFSGQLGLPTCRFIAWESLMIWRNSLHFSSSCIFFGINIIRDLCQRVRGDAMHHGGAVFLNRGRPVSGPIFLNGDRFCLVAEPM